MPTPDDITYGEALRCEVTATDRGGHAGQGHSETAPVCGLSDPPSLEDFDPEIRILFRPCSSEDPDPGDDGQPCDWDGNVPDRLLDFADTLSDNLGDMSDVVPSEEPRTVATAAELLDQVLDAIDQHAPDSMAPYVPPDPDLFACRLDDGYTCPFRDGDEGIQWEDAFEVGLPAEHQDLYTIPILAIDTEDLDVTFDDGMVDWLDQGGIPLLLASEVFEDGAYRTSTWYDPPDQVQETDVSCIPSSILRTEVEAWQGGIGEKGVREGVWGWTVALAVSRAAPAHPLGEVDIREELERQRCCAGLRRGRASSSFDLHAE